MISLWTCRNWKFHCRMFF